MTKPHWLTRKEIEELPYWPDPCKASDPVRQHGDKWYFWDEVWAHAYGPFNRQYEAEVACREYLKQLG